MTDLAIARAAAASYAAVPGPGVRRIAYRDISADIVGNVLAIRGTNSYATLARDLEVGPIQHPTLGPCQAGALLAALGLVDQVPAEVDTICGHSEGGCIAVLLAALRGARALVTFDAPKAGGVVLASLLAAVDVRQLRFSGSVATLWPVLLDRHVREPLIEIGDWTPNPVEAHSIDRAVAWLAAREVAVVA